MAANFFPLFNHLQNGVIFGENFFFQRRLIDDLLLAVRADDVVVFERIFLDAGLANGVSTMDKHARDSLERVVGMRAEIAF